MHDTTADVEKVSKVTGRTASDVKSSMKETVNSKGEHLVEDIVAGDGAGDLRGGIVVGSRNQDRTMKREESVNVNGNGNGNGNSNGNGNNRTRPPSISTRGGGGGGNNSKQASKTSTPIATSFSETTHPQRTRPQRGEAPIKRSHKKGAGLAAQLAAAAAAKAADEDSSPEIEDDSSEKAGDGEPTYCYCESISYGEMVGCDAKDCRREWFHLGCVGLDKAPGKNGRCSIISLVFLPVHGELIDLDVLTLLALVKWYCDECKANLKDKKFNGSSR